MLKKELIFDGNEKQVFATEDPNKVIFRYKDVTLAHKGVKRAVFKGKGVITNKISALLLGELNAKGVPTHFVEEVGDREQLCRKIEIIPLELIVRNRICGSLSHRLGLKEGIKTASPIFDLHYNNDELDDPLINDCHALALGLVSEEELKQMYSIARKANKILCKVLHEAGIELIDMKIEFGRASDDGSIIISDELSPETTRLWDEATEEKLDKDRFRRDLGDVVASYQKVLDRLNERRKA